MAQILEKHTLKFILLTKNDADNHNNTEHT